MGIKDKISAQIEQSDYISRDLSWLKFNWRVLDQVKRPNRNIFERLKFLAITTSNLDEFFMIRVGSLYNYLDYGKERIDYSGLREIPFKKQLLSECQQFFKDLTQNFKDLKGEFEQNGFFISSIKNLSDKEKDKAREYFKRIVYPMLTPMVYDSYHTFPILMNKLLIFGVVTRNPSDQKDIKKLSFVQIPGNIPRFYEIERGETLVFVPVEEIIREHIGGLFRNMEIVSVDLFRITRNGDFSLEENDDIEENFLEEIKRKIKTRRTGRVVRIEVDNNYNKWMMKLLKTRWELEDDNIFKIRQEDLFDLTGLWQIISHRQFKNKIPAPHPPVAPVTYPEGADDIFEVLQQRDILLHQPYNSMEQVIKLIERAAEDPYTLAIKLTIYRLAKDSRVTAALLKAVENGKHVSVLFEVKARFDEENNIREAKRLQQAGCFVIYGISSFKTHTKLLLIVRKQKEKVTRYVHMSSGNYNEDTSRFYTDLGLMSTNEIYAHDISEFFNVITGHSLPSDYQYLITAPNNMRRQLIELIRNEAENAKKGLPSGIVIKINSLEDNPTIDELYKASQAGVPVKLIVRGICCLRPGRKGLSENIEVKSIVGEFLEHSRIFYFHNNNDPKVYGGSADMMVRSFERRLESLFLIVDEVLKQQVINILVYNLRDNVNSYTMQEDGTYLRKEPGKEKAFNIHKEFFHVDLDIITKAKLF
jgi:polyphosphate kinase